MSENSATVENLFAYAMGRWPNALRFNYCREFIPGAPHHTHSFLVVWDGGHIDEIAPTLAALHEAIAAAPAQSSTGEPCPFPAPLTQE